MDTRRLIVALLASMAVFMLWNFIYLAYINPPPPPTEGADDTGTSEITREGGETSSTTSGTANGTSPTTTQATTTPSSSGSGLRVDGAAGREPVILGDAGPDSAYPIEIRIASRGASVSEAFLRDYKQTLDKEDPYQLLHEVESPAGESLPMPGRSFVTPRLRFVNLEVDVDLGNVDWHLDSASTEQVKVWYVDVVSADGEALARVRKTYELKPRAKSDEPEERTYDLDFRISVENLTDANHEMILVQRGPIGMDREDRRADDRKVIGAVYDSGSVVSKDYARKSFLKKTEIIADDDKGQPAAWAAVTNKFFAGIMTPYDRYGAPEKPVYLIESVHLSDREELPNGEEFGDDISFEYVTKPFGIAAGETKEFAFECFLGPKSKRTLERVERYAKRDYFATIGEYFYFCAPESLGRLMMWLLITLHDVPPHNYGLAIIVLVLLVRTLLHPVTKKSQANMMRMQKRMSSIQPKLQEAKKKHANDQQKYQQAMMEIYREAGINPAGQMLTCMPMMLQIPIWAALWASLNSMNEMRHAAFLPFWITDLAGQDALIKFGGPVTIPLIDLLTGPIYSFNLLPILLGVSQLLQARFMPRGNPAVQKDSQNPDQLEQQRKMMMFMSIFFVFILYNAPAGLNLYIMCSNLFGILEQWQIRKHIAKEDEKLQKEQKEIEAGVRKPKERKETWLEKKWKNLQKQAMEAQRLQNEKKKQEQQRPRKN